MNNIRWAIIKNLRQGVTAHLIDEEIDKGRMIIQEKINVFEDDTLIDLFLRIASKELDLMIESLKILESGKRDFELLEKALKQPKKRFKTKRTRASKEKRLKEKKIQSDKKKLRNID